MSAEKENVTIMNNHVKTLNQFDDIAQTIVDDCPGELNPMYEPIRLKDLIAENLRRYAQRKNKMSNKLICPTCKQNLFEQPHDGLNGKDCPQCGQGLSWRVALSRKQSKQNSKNVNLRAPRKPKG